MTSLDIRSWTNLPPLKKGDTFTIQGAYRRRSFWQWVARQPRQLQVFQVVVETVSDGEAGTPG